MNASRIAQSVEQTATITMPPVKEEAVRITERAEQNVDVLVPQIHEELVDSAQIIPQECIWCMFEEVDDGPLPQAATQILRRQGQRAGAAAMLMAAGHDTIPPNYEALWNPYNDIDEETVRFRNFKLNVENNRAARGDQDLTFHLGLNELTNPTNGDLEVVQNRLSMCQCRRSWKKSPSLFTKFRRILLG